MKKILNIVTSVNGDRSFSIKLCNAILEKLTLTYPGSQITRRNLTKTPFPHFEETLLGAFYTPVAVHSEEQKAAIKHSDEAIKELVDADIVVIGVPLYNFGIPSTLKAWIDHVARAGVTFKFTEDGPVGLLANKKVYLAIASGGVYSEGPMKSYDFTEIYLRAILGFIGLKDLTVFRIEGTVVPELKDNAVQKALGIVNEFAF